MQVHASCVAREGRALLLLGPSGAGKSDLALRLIDRGFVLVADDRVDVRDNRATPPARLAGLLEVRGVGLLRFPHEADVPLALALDLAARPLRLPSRAQPASEWGVPCLALDPWAAASVEKAAAAFAVAIGSLPSVAGAFT